MHHGGSAPSTEAAFDRAAVAARLSALATLGVFIGTSSWKYEGWLGRLYTPERYLYRGRPASSRFQRSCLSEYAEVFKTVCVDAAYYTFPTEGYLGELAGQVPEGFEFGFKVTDAITLKRFPGLARFGAMAGRPNPDFLKADLFAESFLAPLETIRSKVGVVMFEFSRFWPSDYARGAEFVRDLDEFLGKLPAGWRFGVELRNRKWLAPEYFDCLARHKIAHVYNSWSAMPPISEQLALAGSRSHPELSAARLLLAPGRTYEQAVRAFQPYDRTHEVNQEAREAAIELLAEALREKRNRTYLYVNNRLEGNALNTIAAVAATDWSARTGVTIPL